MKNSAKAISRCVLTFYALATVWFFATEARAQISAEDYARAERMLGWNAGKLVFNSPVHPEWLEGDRFWYRKQVPDGHEFIYVDPSADVRRPAFDHVKLAAALSTASGSSYEPHKLPFEEFEYLDGVKAVRFWEDTKKEKEQGEGETKEEEEEEVHRRWTCNLTPYECVGPENIPKDRDDEVKSPDGKWIAFAREENLWITHSVLVSRLKENRYLQAR